MHKDIQERYVSLLRSVAADSTPYDMAQLREAELVVTEGATYMDAYAILASLYMAENDCLIGFVPVRGRDSGIAEFYFYPRVDLIQWAGLTDEELTELIRLNDELELNFAEIAATVGRWV